MQKNKPDINTYIWFEFYCTNVQINNCTNK